jgi:3-oxoacyl-[acyl-carrier protein] reductase
MDELTNKIGLVTGGSRGIGREVSIALAKAGLDIAVNYRSRKDEAEVTCRSIIDLGRRPLIIGGDVSNSQDVKEIVARVERELGNISILVNNAGISPRHAFDAMREEDWDEIIEVNLKSAFLMTQAVLPGMRNRGWGRIINMSSLAAHTGGAVGPHYSASKAGLLGLTHFYASRFAKEGITVNSIAPALIETEMLASNAQLRADLVPVGRLGTVKEVAEVVVMLARNGYITGQTINVDGGWYMS